MGIDMVHDPVEKNLSRVSRPTFPSIRCVNTFTIVVYLYIDIDAVDVSWAFMEICL